MTTPEQSRRYYLKHKDKILASQKRRYAANPTHAKEHAIWYYHANKEVISAKRRARYHANPAPFAAENKAWREKNRARRKLYQHMLYLLRRPERLERQKTYRAEHLAERQAYDKARYWAFRAFFLAANKAYRQAHPEVMNEAGHRRRARMRNARTEKIDRQRLIVRDRDICHICGKKIRRPKERSVDHLVPVIHGGDHTEINVALAHRRCNSRRGAGRLPAQLRLFG